MKLVLILAMLTTTGSAFAADYYRCTNVAGVEEWTVEVNMKSKKAAFFDNDSWVKAKFVRTTFAETMPPKTLHYFKGPKVAIEFDVTNMAVDVSGTGRSKDCRAVPKKKDLNSGI